MQNNLSLEHIEAVFTELISHQQSKLLECAQKIVPNITADDLLQPNDFLALENNPLFRYEEGILAGLQAARISLITEIKSGSYAT